MGENIIAHVGKQKDKIGGFQISKLVASLGESIRQTKTIVSKPNDDVPEKVGRQADMNERYVISYLVFARPPSVLTIFPNVLKTKIQINRPILDFCARTLNFGVKKLLRFQKFESLSQNWPVSYFV